MATPSNARHEAPSFQGFESLGDSRLGNAPLAFSFLLNAMEPINLAELSSAAQLMNRVDNKYVFNEDRLPSLLEQIQADYRVLEIDRVRLAPYATLYFDTPDRSCYREHHNGRLRRRKFRMREYLSSGACFLEVKSKNNKGRTDKRRMTLAELEDTISSPSADFIESIIGQRLPLEPQLWTFFSRVTLVGRTILERVTIDLRLHFRRDDAKVSLPKIAITEVKQEVDNRCTPIREALRRLSIQPLRISKYCLGSCLVDPTLKQNRFKRKLRAIQRLS